jgi:hypothetical protein
MSNRDMWFDAILGALILYTVIGLVLFRFWMQRRRHLRPISAIADPVGSVAYQLPLLIYAEIFAGGSGVFTLLLVYVALPSNQHWIVIIDSLIYAIFVPILFVSLDVKWVRHMRKLARKQSTGDAGQRV